MLRVVIYSIGALLLLVGCAKKKQGITCANPDPATGQCLRDATQVVDPNDMEASLRRALQNQEQLVAEVERLRGELAAAKQTGDTQKAEETQQALEKTTTEADKVGLSAPPMVDENKVPAVKLKLQNKNNMGVRVGLSFTHDTNISDFVFYYGGRGRSQVFNFADFTDGGVQLPKVQIPVQLSFKFKGEAYCAKINLHREFEETHCDVLRGCSKKPMQVSEGECKL